MERHLKSINNALSKVDNVLLKIEKTICGVLIVVMACIIFLQIICRMLKFPLDWSEELSRFMFIWLIYISVCIATQKSPICAVIFFRFLVRGAKGRLIIKIISNIFCLCFFIFVAYWGSGCAVQPFYPASALRGHAVNMFWAYLGTYLGAAMAAIHYIILIFREIGRDH